MKNRTLQYLVKNMGQVHEWTEDVKDILQNLMDSKKLDLAQDHFDLLMRASLNFPEEVTVCWHTLNDTFNMTFTWKIGESEEVFVSKFQPFVIN